MNTKLKQAIDKAFTNIHGSNIMAYGSAKVYWQKYDNFYEEIKKSITS